MGDGSEVSVQAHWQRLANAPIPRSLQRAQEGRRAARAHRNPGGGTGSCPATEVRDCRRERLHRQSGRLRSAPPCWRALPRRGCRSVLGRCLQQLLVEPDLDLPRVPGRDQRAGCPLPGCLARHAGREPRRAARSHLARRRQACRSGPGDRPRHTDQLSREPRLVVPITLGGTRSGWRKRALPAPPPEGPDPHSRLPADL